MPCSPGESWGHQELLLAFRKGYQGFERQTGGTAGGLPSLELALEQVGPNPINGRQSLKGWSLRGLPVAHMALLDPVATLIMALGSAREPFPVPVWQEQWRRQRRTYFKLQYRYMDTIMAASWWGRNRER